MTEPREPKKSETVEVRLPHEMKGALMDKARAEGRSASEVIRKSIDVYLAEQPKETRSMFVALFWKPLAATGAAALAIVWSGLATSPAGAVPDFAMAFEALDLNRDKVISVDEFVQHKIDSATARKIHGQAADHGPHAMHGGANRPKPSEQEMRAHFGQVDANADGNVTMDEMRAFHHQKAAAHHKS